MVIAGYFISPDNYEINFKLTLRVLTKLPPILAIDARDKRGHRFIRRPRLYHQKIRHVVRAFRAPTSRRVHVFPRVVPT